MADDSNPYMKELNDEQIKNLQKTLNNKAGLETLAGIIARSALLDLLNPKDFNQIAKHNAGAELALQVKTYYPSKLPELLIAAYREQDQEVVAESKSKSYKAVFEYETDNDN